MDSSMGQNNQPLHLRTIKVDGDALLLQIEEAEHKKEKDQGEGICLQILEVPNIKYQEELGERRQRHCLCTKWRT